MPCREQAGCTGNHLLGCGCRDDLAETPLFPGWEQFTTSGLWSWRSSVVLGCRVTFPDAWKLKSQCVMVLICIGESNRHAPEWKDTELTCGGSPANKFLKRDYCLPVGRECRMSKSKWGDLAESFVTKFNVTLAFLATWETWSLWSFLLARFFYLWIHFLKSDGFSDWIWTGLSVSFKSPSACFLPWTLLGERADGGWREDELWGVRGGAGVGCGPLKVSMASLCRKASSFLRLANQL